MAGQYPFSSIVGKLIDRYGPRTCSFLAAIMFFAAFGLSALEISLAPDYSERSNNAVAHRLTLYFAMAGLGTVLSCVLFWHLRYLTLNPHVFKLFLFRLFGYENLSKIHYHGFRVYYVTIWAFSSVSLLCRLEFLLRSSYRHARYHPFLAIPGHLHWYCPPSWRLRIDCSVSYYVCGASRNRRKKSPYIYFGLHHGSQRRFYRSTTPRLTLLDPWAVYGDDSRCCKFSHVALWASRRWMLQ